jgi:hypothetical protein
MATPTKRLPTYPAGPSRWPGLLRGRVLIRAYLGGISDDTLYRWIHRYRLPVGHLPNGVLFASTSLLDAWLDAAVEAELAEIVDRTGWANNDYGLHSGFRLAHERR